MKPASISTAGHSASVSTRNRAYFVPRSGPPVACTSRVWIRSARLIEAASNRFAASALPGFPPDVLAAPPGVRA